MKRSEINRIMRNAVDFMESFSWKLPEWAFWGIREWSENRENCEEIFNHNLGWDITDFGSGDYFSRGLFLFTLRNGIYGKPGRTYAEKIMIVNENQETPFHFHWNKMEDIINRGGGNLVFQLYKSDPDEGFSDESFDIYRDDRKIRIKAGEAVTIRPGQSLCLEPYVYHRFFGEEGYGPVLTGEVSQVNDDAGDNRFFEPVGRFPVLLEDEDPLHYLVSDYPMLRKKLI